jgi:hypothetical protein
MHGCLYHHFKYLVTSRSELLRCAGAAPFLPCAERQFHMLLLMAGRYAGQATRSASKQAVMWLRVWS